MVKCTECGKELPFLTMMEEYTKEMLLEVSKELPFLTANEIEPETKQQNEVYCTVNEEEKEKMDMLIFKKEALNDVINILTDRLAENKKNTSKEFRKIREKYNIPDGRIQLNNNTGEVTVVKNSLADK